MYANVLNNDKDASYTEQPSQLYEPRLNKGSGNYPHDAIRAEAAEEGMPQSLLLTIIPIDITCKSDWNIHCFYKEWQT